MAYDHKTIEKKWQRYWKKNKTFKAEINKDQKKYYALDMFPYPSGQGLHVGHPEGYTATDVVSRMKRMQGYNVLHPMGWDAFGLPAEQYALKTGHNPKGFTKTSITLETRFNRLASLMTGIAKSTRLIQTTTSGRSGSLNSCTRRGWPMKMRSWSTGLLTSWAVRLSPMKKSLTARRNGAATQSTASQ